jgi:cytolysin-activating lysine-acyltransferase
MIFGARKTITEDGVRSAAGKNGIVPPPHAPGHKEPITKSPPELAQAEAGIQPPPAPKASASTKGALGLRMAQSFAQIVAVLMRDPSYKSLRVTDLEWLVLPPVMAGQFRLAHATAPADSAQAQQGGSLVPVAAALWARVSPQVDKALSETLDKPVQLSQAAWTSGDIPWLMAVAGDRRATQAFLRQLQENEFKGKQVKMRLRGADGKLVITSLDQHTKAA